MAANEKNYTVISTRCDETSYGYLAGIAAEAVIEHQEERKYIEVSWLADTSEGIQVDIVNEPIHDILLEDGDFDEVLRIMEKGRNITDYEEVLKTEYGDICKTLISMLSDRIAMDGYFEDMDEDELPDWYQPSNETDEKDPQTTDSKEAIFRKRLALSTDIRIPNINYDIEPSLRKAVKKDIKTCSSL